MNSKEEMRRGIKTKAGKDMAEKKFQLDEIEADLDNDGKLSEYERARGEAVQKAMAEDEPVEMMCGGLMGDPEGGCGCEECTGGMSIGMDPVSGNMVPPGSNEMNVRDDIPAVLSDGEYVVPADVVRYHGLKTFMMLRDEAKVGLMAMHMEGQIQTLEEEDEHLDEYMEVMECPECEGEGCEHCDGRGYHYTEEYEDDEMPNYKDKQAEMTDLNYDGQEEYETPEDNVVEIAQTEIEEEFLEPEEDDEYSSDGKNTYRPSVKIALMKS